jgi:transposase InsO family protein
VSDNGPQFSSAEFDQFAKSWGFDHITSSLFHPQGNALAEKGMGIANKADEKS